MDQILENFTKSCLELAKEFLSKESLSQNEETFLKNLDLVLDKYIK